MSALAELGLETTQDSAPSAATMDTARLVHVHALLQERQYPHLLQLESMVFLYQEKITPILDSAALPVTTAIARQQRALRSKKEFRFGIRRMERLALQVDVRW
jgi:hypothetical protein